MAKLVFLGPQVRAGMIAGSRTAGDALDHVDAAAFKLFHFVRIVRKEAHGAQAQRFQRLGREFVVAGIGGKSQAAVGLNSIEPAVLQLVGLQFIEQPNAAALLWKVQHDSGGRLGDFAQREFELRAAIAALGGKHVTSEALRMNADQRSASAARIAVDDGYGLVRRAAALDAHDAKFAEARGQLRLRDQSDFAGFFLLRHQNQEVYQGSPDGSPYAIARAGVFTSQVGSANVPGQERAAQGAA